MLQEMGVRVWLPDSLANAIEKEALDSASAREKPVIDALAANPAVARPATPVAAGTVGVLPAGIEAMPWAELQTTVAACQACTLCNSRKQTVFGVGSHQARWMVVGEVPGEQEDQQGEPFVGREGQLLDNMLLAMGLNRGSAIANGVYITHALKCRPPANRNPQAEEAAQCAAYLRRQVQLLQPQMILALGRFAALSLLSDSVPNVASIPLDKLRSQVHHHQGVPVIVSYHPAYLLRRPVEKSKAWADLCLALDRMQSKAQPA